MREMMEVERKLAKKPKKAAASKAPPPPRPQLQLAPLQQAQLQAAQQALHSQQQATPAQVPRVAAIKRGAGQGLTLGPGGLGRGGTGGLAPGGLAQGLAQGLAPGAVQIVQVGCSRAAAGLQQGCSRAAAGQRGAS
jgi:hypothetical protein